MSENKHTPEPWEVIERGDYGSGREADLSVEMDNAMRGYLKLEDARRIVACVNACAGISQQYLEELNGETLADKQMVLITQRDEYSLLAYRRQNILDEVIKQRDKLLAALEHFATWARCQHRAQSKGCHATFDMMMLRDEIDFAEAAIASVKELK